jgi:hypothetical protein
MKTTIGKIFEIEWGQKEYHSKEHLEGKSGKTILISSSGEDNGVYGFFDIPIKYKAPFITVPSTGTIGYAFLQEKDCCVNDDVLILNAKEKLTKTQLLQVVYQIRKNKWKYSYGRKIIPERLSKQIIVIEDINIDAELLTNSLIPKIIPKKKIKENRNIKLLRVLDLCKIERKNALPQNAINLRGNIPYVTTSLKNNGVTAFVDEMPNTESKCISVALNGSVGEVFFQAYAFITSGDNAVLRLKAEYNPYLLIYIGALIKKHQWRYNYYSKMSLDKLKNLKLPIPFKNDEIDFDYIESIVKNSYGYMELKAYL